MMLLSLALAAAGMAAVPWIRDALSLNVCFAALGVPLGFVDTGRWRCEPRRIRGAERCWEVEMDRCFRREVLKGEHTKFS